MIHSDAVNFGSQYVLVRKFFLQKFVQSFRSLNTTVDTEKAGESTKSKKPSRWFLINLLASDNTDIHPMTYGGRTHRFINADWFMKCNDFVDNRQDAFGWFVENHFLEKEDESYAFLPIPSSVKIKEGTRVQSHSDDQIFTALLDRLIFEHFYTVEEKRAMEKEAATRGLPANHPYKKWKTACEILSRPNPHLPAIIDEYLQDHMNEKGELVDDDDDLEYIMLEANSMYYSSKYIDELLENVRDIHKGKMPKNLGVVLQEFGYDPHKLDCDEIGPVTQCGDYVLISKDFLYDLQDSFLYNDSRWKSLPQEKTAKIQKELRREFHHKSGLTHDLLTVHTFSSAELLLLLYFMAFGYDSYESKRFNMKEFKETYGRGSKLTESLTLLQEKGILEVSGTDRKKAIKFVNKYYAHDEMNCPDNFTAPTFGIYIDDWERENSTAISKLSNPDTISKELVENLVTDAIVYLAQKHDPVLAQMSTNTMEQKHAIEDHLFISDYLVLLHSAVNPIRDVLTDAFVDAMEEKSPLCRRRMEKDD